MAKVGRKRVGTRLDLRIPDPIVAALRERAAERDQTLAATAREALARGVAELQHERTPTSAGTG